MILVKVKRMYKTKGGFQLTLQTLSLVVGYGLEYYCSFNAFY